MRPPHTRDSRRGWVNARAKALMLERAFASGFERVQLNACEQSRGEIGVTERFIGERDVLGGIRDDSAADEFVFRLLPVLPNDELLEREGTPVARERREYSTRPSNARGMTVTTHPTLVVALDLDDFEAARSLVDRLAPLGVWFKVGYEPLYGYGDAIRAHLEARGANVFLDAKMHDIPRTVEAGMRALVRPGVRIVTVHALGGNAMLQAAVIGANERAAALGIEPPEVFAITLLTSIAPEDLGELGLGGGPQENVFRLAALARDARCAGVVCSPHEARDLKAFFGSDFKVICPGIRPGGTAAGDQKRVATPRSAVEAGADYLVVGRPIVGAPDPVDAARAILAEMNASHAPAHGERPA